MGFQLRKSTIIDLRGDTVHPLTMAYTAVKMGTMPLLLMDIPTSKCRTQLWHTLEESRNPFVKTIVDYSNNKTSDYNSSFIKAYYESYMPQNACEVLRLSDNEQLKQIPAYGYILPWDNQDVTEILKIRERIALNENRQEGKQIDISAGYTDFGPVDAEKGEIELNRMIRTFKSIKKQGYKEKPYLSDGGIRGYFLTGDDDEWCFIVKAGKHRAYALSALGYQNIPVVIDNNIGMIKRLDDLRFWPQLSCGIFSEEEAYILANNILKVENQS
ncbi:MAG TPA: hypothetical protein PK110_12785 [Niabella sp.]|nr:hypothetical protein [Niabella sp.]